MLKNDHTRFTHLHRRYDRLLLPCQNVTNHSDVTVVGEKEWSIPILGNEIYIFDIEYITNMVDLPTRDYTYNYHPNHILTRRRSPWPDINLAEEQMSDHMILRGIADDLKVIRASLKDLTTRVEAVEGNTTVVAKQTKEIHQFVPFVGWLSHLATKLPLRFLGGADDVPQLEDCQ